jgi:hypothetical protein
MKTLLSLSLILALPLSGCAILAVPARGSQKGGIVVAKQKDCHPSQYWDGNECKHKGKGHGARKHDGEDR